MVAVTGQIQLGVRETCPVSLAALHKSTQLYCFVGKPPVMHIGYKGVHLPWFDDMAFVFPYSYS